MCVHIILRTHHRSRLIGPEQATHLFRYIAGLVRHPKRKNRVIAVNGVEDHVHVAVHLHPDQAVSVLVRDVKSLSTAFMNRRFEYRPPFRWGRGYGVFTFRTNEAKRVGRYVRRQQVHHGSKEAFEEFVRRCRYYDTEFDPSCLWEDDEEEGMWEGLGDE